MTALPNLNGWIRHLLLTIALNFASPQAIVYGYLVPVFFLLAFGSVFRADAPPLQAHMGQILTITILGGACFGLPTALVSEREQGVWRRYRLLPIPVAWLVFSAMVARVLIVASAVLIQIAMARAVYGTPLPTQPGVAVLAFFLVTAAFLAIGLLIAALADTVPAVQALGQCIFLPMIMIGGVGVPLTALPDWAQRVAGFMPGRYAVEVLQPCFDGRNGLPSAGFRLGALGVIGLAAGVAAVKLFRWEAGARLGRPARLWVAAALTAWMSVGAVAWQTGHLKPILPDAAAWTNITEAQIAEIRFDGLPADHDLVAPIAPPTPENTVGQVTDPPGQKIAPNGDTGGFSYQSTPAQRANTSCEAGGLRLPAPDSHANPCPPRRTEDPSVDQEFAARLAHWPQARLDDSGQAIRNLVSIAAVADLCADPRESEIARLVFRQISTTFDPAVSRQVLAWIILSPEDGQALTKAPELGLFRHPPERLVRQRSVLYAEKYLGRLLGKIPD